MNTLLALGFSHYANKQTGSNSAMSYLLKNAISGDYPGFSILYAEVLITRSDLPNVLAPKAVSETAGKLAFSWKDNSGTGIAKTDDKVILAAYCPALNQCIYTTGSASLSALTDSLDLTTFTGKPLHTYIGCISDDGRNIATSIYTGMITVS